MKIPADLVIRQFLRTYTNAFSGKEFSIMLGRVGVKTTIDECEKFLSDNDMVFTLPSGMYITRACAFSNQYFSFKPTRKEYNKKMFIVGHRCMPFVDVDMLSCSLSFLFNGEKLPTVVGQFDSGFVSNLYSLFGDEFSAQYIAADPANKDIDLAASDFRLPPVIKSTCIDMTRIINAGFEMGDRLVCKVVDWDTGSIEINIAPHEGNQFQIGMQDVERENWYRILESLLLKNFDRVGPCSSIEEQLALVFADSRNELCIRNCGSIDEMFTRTKKIGFELFGVETRLWKKGEDVPAVGIWNHDEVKYDMDDPCFDEPFNMEPRPDYIIDSYIKDMIYSGEDDVNNVMKRIYPSLYRYSEDEQRSMMLHLKTRHDILMRNYNKFADYSMGSLRKKALELYTTVNELVSAIDSAGFDLTIYPQQPLVILTQIFGHVMHILEMSENNPKSVMDELDEVELSIEGMECNFESINGQLKNVIDKESRNGFSIVK